MPRLIPAVCVLLVTALPAAAQLPTYRPPEVRAIASAAGLYSLGFHLRMNARGDLLLRPQPTDSTIATWVNGVIVDLPVIVSQVALGEAGEVYVSGPLIQDLRVEGIWRFTPPAGPPELLIEGRTASPLAVTDTGAVTYFQTAQRLVRWDPETEQTIIIAEGTADHRLVAQTLVQSGGGRVGLLHNFPGDQIWRHDPDGTSTLIAQQPFLTTGNSLSINSAGEVAFRSSWALHRSDGSSTVEIASSLSDVQGLGMLTAVSDTGLVAFRARGLDGVQGVYIGDGTEIARVAAVGDTIWTELGPTVITEFVDTSGTMGWGTLRMSPAGDIAFIARTSGSSVNEALVLLRIGPPCKVDWHQDGSVDSVDLSAYLTAWIRSVVDGTLDADFNGDSAVNAVDISDFLQAWLAAATSGC